MTVSVAIVGAAGRMGRALVQTIASSADLQLAAAIDRPASPHIGHDAGEIANIGKLGCRITEHLAECTADVVVDFSLPAGTDATLAHCREHGLPLVLGTTGLREAQETAVHALAGHVPLVRAANFSVGVTLLNELVQLTASILDWEAEILEVHHRHKRDAPSGTALRLGRAIAHARERRLDEVATYDRHELDRPRSRDEIGMVAMRGGDVVGEHTVSFFGDGERIELAHRASDRTIFARGALRAARWLRGCEPGLYDMLDVLGLRRLQAPPSTEGLEHDRRHDGGDDHGQQ